MGAITSIISMLTVPWEQFLFYVANDCSVHSECGGDDACCTFDCETEGQDALQGGETEIETECCMFRHID